MALAAVLPRIAAALVLLVSTGTFAAGADFATALPDGVSDVAGWEVVSGEFETAGLRGDYRFYVNPQRQAMYQLMRFRTASGGGAGGPLGAERVAFVRRPGTPEPMLCWERQPAGAGTEWRALVPGSSEYTSEMSMLMRVLAVHRAASAARER
jgi:hypothetical protein